MTSTKRILSYTRMMGAALSLAVSASAWSAVVITLNNDPAALATGLGGAGLTIVSANATNGDQVQFGTYSNFSQPPVTIANGVVLSTGDVSNVSRGSSIDSTSLGQPGTAEFNAYGPLHIENFITSNDVARLQVIFSLSAPSAVAFDFVFGSIEFPEFTSEFTDAFLVFLDGPETQIVFDTHGVPVQVGTSFAQQLSILDQNTEFSDPHGLLASLTTTTAVLAAGEHTLLFEVGDLNDDQLDSAVFITNLRLADTEVGTTPTVPVPPAMGLFASALAGLWAKRRYQAGSAGSPLVSV